jgi:threonine aldolase
MHAVEVDEIGAVSPDAVRGALKEDDFHSAISRLLCLENTVGGQVIPLDQMKAAAQAA